MRYIFFILIILGCGKLAAQSFHINGAIVSISPGTILSLPDSIVNNGTLINNGQIVIHGSWINSGIYDAGNGQVSFDSDNDQVINHNAQIMESLIINGSGKKEFLADIIVQSELVLNSGILVSNNGARLVIDYGAKITGGSDISHVQGPVERKGIGDWLFPVGNGTKYLPVTISSIKDATAFGILTLHEVTSEVLTVDNTLAKISNKHYWELASSGDALSSSIIVLPTSDEDLDGELTTGASNAATGPYSDLIESAPTFKYYAIATKQTDHSIEVFNAVSPGNDGKNDFMMINNIEFFPGNTVLIHNRWGDKVFGVSGYDNNQVAFRGMSDKGDKLPAGTYFYSIDLGDGSKKTTGYVVVR